MNTLAMANKLKRAGVPEAHAEAHVEVLQEATEGLATKADLREAVAELKASLAWQVVGAMVSMTMIFIAAVKYL